jgi:hypothetical protein
MKRIFIGGTGRSGTSILLHALSFQPNLITIPIETKFIVQVDGLHSLVSYLTEQYSPSHGAVAVARFKQLMYEVITHTGDNPYADFVDEPYGRMEFLPQEIFPNYFESLDRFFAELSPRHHRRRTIIEKSRELIDELFGTKATASGAHGWIEKTPSNIVRIEFLYELFPDAIFINCIRDPRGVLHSFQRLKWILGSAEEGAEYLAAYYDFLTTRREFGLSRPRQYYELKLEHLVADPTNALADLLGFLKIAPFSDERNEYLLRTLREGNLQWSPSHGRYRDAWEREYSDETIGTISTTLASAIKDYGYST